VIITPEPNPSTGKVNILVLLIKFPEDEKNPNLRLADREYLERTLNGDMKEWFRYNSLGKYDVTFRVQDWAVAPKSQAAYSGGIQGRRGSLEMQEVFDWKLDQLGDDSEETGLFWKQFDSNGDKVLDHLLVLHSGVPAEVGGAEECAGDSMKRIWSQATPYGGHADGWKSKTTSGDDEDDEQYRLGGYALVSAIGLTGNICADPTPLFDIGMAAHELMHGFDLLDLYDMDYEDPDDGPIQTGGVGNFDIMANTFGWNWNASIPGHLSTYSRMEAGWVDPIVIERNGYYAALPAELSGSVYKIEAGFPPGEYLLIENRLPIMFDRDWPVPGGIVIYHVDEKMSQGNTHRGYPGKKDWPKDHYMVAVQQADGRYDLEKGVNLGDEDDFWVGGMVLGPNDDGKTWPNTDAYQDGVVKKTGIKIEILLDPGYIVTFKVDGIREVSGAAGVDDEEAVVSAMSAEDQYETVYEYPPEQFSSMEEDGNVTTSAGSISTWILATPTILFAATIGNAVAILLFAM